MLLLLTSVLVPLLQELSSAHSTRFLLPEVWNVLFDTAALHARAIPRAKHTIISPEAQLRRSVEASYPRLRPEVRVTLAAVSWREKVMLRDVDRNHCRCSSSVHVRIDRYSLESVGRNEFVYACIHMPSTTGPSAYGHAGIELTARADGIETCRFRHSPLRRQGTNYANRSAVLSASFNWKLHF